MGVVELGVGGGRLLAALAALDDAAQLAPERDPEVERGADPLGAERQAVAGRVAGEEDAALGRRPAACAGSSCPGSGPCRAPRSSAQQLGRLPDVEAGVEGADPDPGLLAGRERPAVAGGHVAAVDPDLEVLGAALGVHLEPARERRVRRLETVAEGQHPAPAERVDDQRRADHAAVGLDRDRPVAVLAAGAAVDLGGLEAGVAVGPEQLAELAVVEGGEGPGEPVAGVAVGRVHDQRVEALALAVHQSQPLQPLGRDPAGGGLALADLVAVDDHHVGAGAGQLARDRQPGEAGAADEDVVRPAQRRPLVAPLGGSDRHRGPILPSCAARVGHRDSHPCAQRNARRRLKRLAAANRRQDRPQLRGDDGLVRRGRRRQRQSRPDRQRRGSGRHRLQGRGRHSRPTSSRSASRSIRPKRSSSARRSTPSSSPRRTPRGV